MAPVVEDIRRLTLADFDAFVVAAATEDAYELIDGELAMMVNPTETHEQIAANIGAPLKLAMDRRGCRTYQGGMRVQLSNDFGAGNSYRPDVLVRCGQTGEQPGNKTYVTDPIVIVEVLSPSTIDLDRGRSCVSIRRYRRFVTSSWPIRIRCAWSTMCAAPRRGGATCSPRPSRCSRSTRLRSQSASAKSISM